MSSAVVIQNTLIMLGLSLLAIGVILLSIRLLVGRSIVVKITLLVTALIALDAILAFILGQIGFTPLNILFIFGPGTPVNIIGFYYLVHLVAKPLEALTQAAHPLAQGDLSEAITYESEDELGQVAEAFRGIAAYQKEMVRVAEKIAAGDLTVNLTPRSEKGMAQIRLTR